MIYPDEKQFLCDSVEFSVIPVFEVLRADFETPLSIFVKTQANFLLESVEQGENVGRHSIIALGKKCVIKIYNRRIQITEYSNGEKFKQESSELKNPLNQIREYFSRYKIPDYPGLPPFFGGAIGYLGYETVQFYEDIPVKEDNESIPDGLMVFPEAILVFDTIKRSISVIISVIPGKDPQKSFKEAVEKINEISSDLSKELNYREPPVTPEDEIRVRSNMKKNEFMENVATCRQYIEDGEIIQAVLSQKLSIETTISPFELYRTLRILNPSPYLFYLNFDDFCLVGSSPEVMVRLQNKEILLKPIAGTRKRGANLAEDVALACELLENPKERAEHMMLVDLGRNDLGRVAAAGSVEVTDYMAVEKYSHVMHIVSTIKAELEEAYDVFDVIQATFPAGTLTGAPKVRAMEIIAELEPEKRGPYGGMVFNLGFNGNMDSCIVIRTLLLKDGVAVVQAGAGIVADSEPEKEYQESLNKSEALLETIRITRHRRNC
jgi:anthranilate synthase component 1